jgi:hypothetical protein
MVVVVVGWVKLRVGVTTVAHRHTGRRHAE